MKLKLFFSYSHKDRRYLESLKNQLSLLKSQGLINTWSDRCILAGAKIQSEIDKNMDDADIILLLFSADFIASESCEKEVNKALELHAEKGTIVIPLILKTCSWQDIDPSLSDFKALPKDGKAISLWKNKDEAWQDVYIGIKNQVEKIFEETQSTLKSNFNKDLLENPIARNWPINKLFVYPDLSTSEKQEEEKINSKELKNITKFEHKHILIEGNEQIGKTTLGNMLYLHYFKKDFYPILMHGKDIVGKADIKKIIKKLYNEQYENPLERDYWSITCKGKRILIIDDVDEENANDQNFKSFIYAIKEYFEYSILFTDAIMNLSKKSGGKYNELSSLPEYKIMDFGHEIC